MGGPEVNSDVESGWDWNVSNTGPGVVGEQGET